MVLTHPWGSVMSTGLLPSDEIAFTANVVPFRLRVTERHHSNLLRWLEAGSRMGLHDAEVVYRTPQGGRHDGYVLIWVRENPDPAYRVVPIGIRWSVIDHLRNRTLGRFATFEAALDFIRPFAATNVASDDHPLSLSPAATVPLAARAFNTMPPVRSSTA